MRRAADSGEIGYLGFWLPTALISFGGQRRMPIANCVAMSGGDPVRTGLVANLNQPGGNLTGVSLLSLDMEAKRLGLLHDLIPQASTIAVLADSTSASTEFQVQQTQTAARRIGMSIRIVTVGNEGDLEPAFATMVQEAARKSQHPAPCCAPARPGSKGCTV